MCTNHMQLAMDEHRISTTYEHRFVFEKLLEFRTERSDWLPSQIRSHSSCYWLIREGMGRIRCRPTDRRFRIEWGVVTARNPRAATNSIELLTSLSSGTTGDAPRSPQHPTTLRYKLATVATLSTQHSVLFRIMCSIVLGYILQESAC